MSAHGGDWPRLGTGMLPTEDEDTGLGHIVPVKLYLYVYLSLIVLTALTVWAATQDFGIFNLAVALGIATIKAGVVTLIFMHLNWESKITWGIVIYPIFIFILILGGTLGDETIKDKPRRTNYSGAPAEAPAVDPTVVPTTATPAASVHH